MDIKEIASFISDAGVVGLLVAVILGGLKQLWVWGWLYKDKVRECDEWKLLALEGLQAAHTGASVAERVLEQSVPTRLPGTKSRKGD